MKEIINNFFKKGKTLNIQTLDKSDENNEIFKLFKFLDTFKNLNDSMKRLKQKELDSTLNEIFLSLETDEEKKQFLEYCNYIFGNYV